MGYEKMAVQIVVRILEWVGGSPEIRTSFGFLKHAHKNGPSLMPYLAISNVEIVCVRYNYLDSPSRPKSLSILYCSVCE